MHWGTSCWLVLHGLACFIPNEVKYTAWLLSWFRAMTTVIPCPECRSHALYLLNTQKYPITKVEELRSALWEFHNAVNRRAGKQQLSKDKYDLVHAQGDIFKKIRMFERVLLASGRGRRDFMNSMIRKRNTHRLADEAIFVCKAIASIS